MMPASETSHDNDLLLDVRDLCVEFETRNGVARVLESGEFLAAARARRWASSASPAAARA